LGTHDGVEIMARPEDNFVDVTAMCQAHGKSWSEYARSSGATRVREALSASLENIQAGSEGAGLVVTSRAETGQQGHTFADRRIALHCAALASAALSASIMNRDVGSDDELVVHTSSETGRQGVRLRRPADRTPLRRRFGLVRTSRPWRACAARRACGNQQTWEFSRLACATAGLLREVMTNPSSRELRFVTT
jgi:hypothetical protein